MPELTFQARPARPSPEPRPHVERHTIDWGVNDFSALTTRRIGAMGHEIRSGCHFLNPLYTVSCPRPIGSFYRKATWAREGWIRLLKKTIDPKGFRRLSEELGPSARQLQISGVMYLDGTPIPPPLWEQHTRVALNPDLALISTTHRPVRLPNLHTPEGQQALMALSRSELQRLLSSQPDAASYVTPVLTLSAPRLTPTFLAEAREAENQWHGRLHRHLGMVRKAQARSSDLPTRMLVFHGVLLVGGNVYLPGCWPDRQPSKADLGQTPYGSPTVPPGFLGLVTPVPDESLSHESTACPQGPNRGGPNATTLNELLQTLFQTGGGSPR